MTLLIIPGSLWTVVALTGGLAILGLLAILFFLIVRPALLIQRDRESPPPEEGSIREIILDAATRNLRLSIGQLDSDLKTRMNGIVEDHLVIRFAKDRDLEEYEIELSNKGPVQLRVPHSKKLESMSGREIIESRELIGDTAVLRLVAGAREGRALQYVDFELAAKYFINRTGDERMKFVLTLKKIFPSLDKNSRSKKGVYMFARLKVGQQDEAQ